MEPRFARLMLAATSELYRLARRAKEESATGEERVGLRREESLAILEAVKAVPEAKSDDHVSKHGPGDAVRYTLNN